MEETGRSSNQEANNQSNDSNCRNKNEDEITVTEPKISKQTEGAQSSIDGQGKDEYYARYWPLYRMIEKNDWRGVEDFVTNDPDALTAKTVAPGSQTIFHAIVESLVDVESDDATCLLHKLASKVDPQTLARQDVHGHTALYQCAGKGNLRALKVLVKYNPDLTTIRSKGNNLPVHKAAYEGHKDTFRYLLEVTHGVDIFSGNDGAEMLSRLIGANLYDVALDLLKLHPTIGRDSIDSRRIVLNKLAQKPYAFASGSRLGRLQRLIYNCTPVEKELVPSIQTNGNQNVDGDMENLIVTSKIHSKTSTRFGSAKQITTTFGATWHKSYWMLWNALMRLAPSIKALHEQKLAHMQTVEIVRIICKEVIWTRHIGKLRWALFTAARLGIHEFVNEFIMAYNRTAIMLNKDGRNIFDVAVLHRREKVFNLIHRVNFTTNLFLTEGDPGSNILHLAAELVPSSEVAGAALQMQRELQWFKAVEKLIHPDIIGDEISSNQTPRKVFTEKHKDLVKEGEKWMKETASSCSVVAALIITVVFAAAFTVPGGSDGRGIPNLLHEKSFMIFAISDMLALFSSITSVLMFLGILTSRYAEDDFLVSLPRKLIIGLVALFFSIASMMVAFGATVHISLSHKWNLVIIPIALVGCVPVTLFALLQFPLLLDMYSSTYGRSIIIDSSWRELASCGLVAKGSYKTRL
ncbi:protein ACCELERATED CELL DEATH 6 [Citrus clementina]|uniref:protein ACCELERATED CELL DEATH 6 n=1 Tax=Citrus clementina TaxID=85681 RepID=UPI000CECEFC6|nr:protein ACCELERATED CELL DEATH 6 [Citrus x clementina]